MNTHGGNIYDFSSPESIVDFSSNINPYGPPLHAMEAARDALPEVARYPDTTGRAIRQAFASWLGMAPEQFVFGNGASELIGAVFAAIAPKRLLVPSPTFSGYAACASRIALPVVSIPSNERDDFAFDIDLFKRTFREGDLIVACQPNNPTGRAWKPEELCALSSICAGRGWLMVDECFINLTYPKCFSCASLIPGGHVILLRAVTKDFSAPGLRVGFTVTSAELASLIRAQLQPWPLNSVGEVFAIACARSPEPFLSDSAELIARERKRLVRGLKSLGYAPLSAAANFMLVKGKHPCAGALYEKLSQRSILIRRCDNFPGLDDRYFRIAVRAERDNDYFLSTLAMI